MRQHAGRLNRVWLVILGILLLLSGLIAVLIGTSLLPPAARAVGQRVDRPASTDRVLPVGADIFELTWLVVALAVVGLLLVLLAVRWLLAQIPRTNQAKPFRLHDDARDGLTRCASGVLTNAVEAQIRSLPDVQDASAVLRGTVRQPDLTVKVTASERADLPQLLDSLQHQVAADLGVALDTQVRRLGVQVEIGTTKIKAHQIDLDPRRISQAVR